MTQEDKQLLLKDLCARLPYHPIVRWTCDGKELDEELKHLSELQIFWITRSNNVEVKPYLRPMSSMTEEEVKEIQKINWQFGKSKSGECYVGDADDGYCSVSQMVDILGYLNEHHFDYRGLIEKGLAIEVTEENNPYN